jgi:hypothetical protein
MDCIAYFAQTLQSKSNFKDELIQKLKKIVQRFKFQANLQKSSIDSMNKNKII